MIDAGWCIARSSARSAEDAIVEIAERLAAQGRVRESFARAAVLRERTTPTGLPFEPPAVALPHVDAAHVIASSIAVLTLATPVSFREMGTPESAIDIAIVIVPAFATKESPNQAGSLAQLVALLQDRTLRIALTEAKDAEGLARTLSGAFLLQ